MGAAFLLAMQNAHVDAACETSMTGGCETMGSPVTDLDSGLLVAQCEAACQNLATAGCCLYENSGSNDECQFFEGATGSSTLGAKKFALCTAAPASGAAAPKASLLA